MQTDKFDTASKLKWRKIGTNRRAGLLVPLFSVYSKQSIGIGDLQDLKLLVDLAKISGNSIIQLLPMNEIGPVFCPYDSVSSFALEPMYISFAMLDASAKGTTGDRIDALRKQFPAGAPYVDYRIKKAKIDLLREMYLQDNALSRSEFRTFRRQNQYWLDGFALYKVLKEYQRGRPWYEWEDKYKGRHEESLASFKRGHEKEIAFQEWLQWQLYKQFKEVKSHAKKNKILLKGDLPILVSRDSADVWQRPEFFKLEFASGAPPDMYCAKGQRWGMPTYNWERIAADNYRYIREKLKYAQNFYDMMRIDHVVGMFRIWSIPYGEPVENQGLNGFFDPSDEKVWKEHGRKILSVVMKNTDMLICAEDLGVIPRVCPEVIGELGIPGNDVQRWVKDWQIKHDFLIPQDYRLLSVTMLSTHDTTNWPAWWEKEAGTVDSGLMQRMCSDHRQIGFDAVKDRLFDNSISTESRLRWLDSVDSVDKLVSILGKNRRDLNDFTDIYLNSFQEKDKLWTHLGIGGSMKERCDPKIIEAALRMNLESRAIFCVNTLIDWLFLTDVFKGDPYKYRINTPGTVSNKNWSLVIPLSLDGLLEHEICSQMKEMIVSSGRG